MATKKLFTPITLGGKNNPITLSHRVAMAPLTRLKADADGVQPDMATTYYSQRASKGGLIIAEATHISETARGYFGAPGIYSDKQIASWKKITDGVHAKDGKVFLQIWHTGRLSHPLNQPNGQLPVSSSSNMDITTGQMVPTPEGFKPHVAPRALKTEEIPQISKDFKTATQNALEAGFDGVEFHCANGYLPEQFLQDGINDRTDRYGGSIENRARFLFETLESILDVIDSSRVGIRLAPYSMSFGQCESKPLDTYGYVMKKLNDYDLAYAHLIEPRAFPLHESPNAPNHGIARDFRPMYDGVLMTASGYNRETAIKVVEDGDADMVAIGRAFISNPDLPRRFELDAPINAYNPDTFYTPGPAGYIDQPSLEEQQ